jgi:hypothetical protein
MPYRFEFDAVHKVLMVVLEGKVPGWEVEKYHQQMPLQIERLNPAALICDYSAVTHLDISAGAIRELAHKDHTRPESLHRFIVAQTPHIFGLARMYTLYADRSSEALQSVHTRAEALTALGLGDLQIQPVTL